MQHWVRILAKVAAGFLSVWFLLLPVTANALGLGNIKMDSSLNEPLKAEIELLSATSDDIKGLEVKLASREAFLRAGVDRSVQLSQIKFDIVKRDSKYFVVLSTPQAIREPFLNFLVELNWKNGRMLREYTVLLDPAERGEQQRIAQAPETTPPVSSPEPTPIPAPTAAQPEPVPAPTSPFMASPETPAPAPAETAKTESEPSPSAKQEVGTPVPEPVPAPMAAAPEPAPVPAPAPAPEPIAKAETPVPVPTEIPAPEQPFEGQQDDGGLFPEIPLTAYRESETDMSAPAPVPAPAGEQAAAAPEPVGPAAGELDYGITKKGDNLWRIAEKLKPNDQVTVYQVMMALQQSNPKAFIDGNIHRLKVGQVMRIDNPSLLTAMNKADALKQYERQTTAWEGYLAQTGKNVPRQAIVAGEQAPTPAEPGVTSGELTLSTPQSEKMTAGSGGAEESTVSSADAALLEQQARKAMEEAKKQKQKNTELTARLDDLDAELKRMENLVTIKDSDLASLQHKLDELNAQRAAAKASTPAPEEPAKPETAAPPEPVTAPSIETPPTEVAKTQPEEAAKPAAEAEPTPVEPKPAPAVTQPAQPAVPAAPPVAVPAPTPTPQPVTAQAKDSGGIMGMIKGILGGVMGSLNAMMLIIGGVVVVVILLIGFILMRRRKGVNFQESILTSGDAGDIDSVSMDASPSQGSSLMGGESSFLSDFAISGVSAIQAEDSEVDPLTEADVFMAYGRYEAAEERLQEAISNDPKRGELRVKLLELFKTTKNQKAFETAAEDYYANLGGNVSGNPLWQKVVAMGAELLPGNPLFSGGVAGTAKGKSSAARQSSNASDNHVMDIGLDTGVFNTSDFTTDAFNESPAASSAGMDSEMVFNLEAGSAADKGDEDSVLNFSMEGLSDQSAATDDLDFSMDAKSDDFGGLDFNLDTGNEPSAGAQAPAAHGDMDFSLDLAGDEEPTATEIKLGMGDESPDTGLDFDFGEDLQTGHASGMDLNMDASDASISLDISGAGDEVGTKLDLARAYIDMGDPDGARSILDEVLVEGNTGQKQEAQQLMTQIG